MNRAACWRVVPVDDVDSFAIGRNYSARTHAVPCLCVFAGRVYACELCIIGRMLLCRFGRECCTISGLMKNRGGGRRPLPAANGTRFPADIVYAWKKERTT